MKQVSIMVLLAAATVSTGCGLVSIPQPNSITLQADERGLRAFNDLIVGSATEGKARPNSVSAYWKARNEQEQTERRPGFFTSLLKGGSEQ
jgi:hypothetical protein